MSDDDSFWEAFWLLVAVVALLAGYINHIVWCIAEAAETGSAIALLIVGILVPPVGVVHGISLLFGWTWI